MENTIELNSKWTSDKGLEVTVVELLQKGPTHVVIFYTEDSTGIKRSSSKNGFLFRFSKR